MASQEASQAQPGVERVEPEEPRVVPDVATQPHPAGDRAGAQVGEAPDQRLQDILPEVKELAQKVGGYKQLSEIAGNLDDVAE